MSLRVVGPGKCQGERTIKTQRLALAAAIGGLFHCLTAFDSEDKRN